MEAVNLLLLFPLIQLPRKSEVTILIAVITLVLTVSINSTSEEVRRVFIPNAWDIDFQVSINSTSEEVRSSTGTMKGYRGRKLFPLIQLPRKSEGLDNPAS